MQPAIFSFTRGMKTSMDEKEMTERLSEFHSLPNIDSAPFKPGL
jgi:hypothetical protein